MMQTILNWFWGLTDQDMAFVIGLGLIALSWIMAVSRKLGKWT